MRKRNVHIQFWLDKKEAEAFQKKVKKSACPACSGRKPVHRIP